MMTRYILPFLWLTLFADARLKETSTQRNYNPCCSMPCQHRGVCVPLSNILYECDCARGYFGRSCEKATFSRWISDHFKLSETTKLKLALTGKLIWGVVNNVPMLHDTALRYVYLSGSQFGGIDHQLLNFADDYTSFDVYCNRTLSDRGLPPVPVECPTPLGIKGPKKLPSVEDVFELLFKRRNFKSCPHGTNVMLATFAQYLSRQSFSADLPYNYYKGLFGNDATNIYGSDEVTRKNLRSMINGKLKTRMINGEAFPPYLEDSLGVTMNHPKPKKDGKQLHPQWVMSHKLLGMTSPLIFAMATIWFREHNRLCDIVFKEHPNWSDERIYQTVRRILLGELLTITAGEYFQQVAQYRLKFGYKPQLFHDNPVLPSPQLQYESSLIFKWHQTMPDGMVINGEYYNLTDHTFRSGRIIFEHGLDALVDAMSRNPVGQITYGNCGEAAKDEMKSLIEEGRRMRLRSLNDYRRFFDLKPYETFMDLVGDGEMADKLEDLYGDVDAVEFVVGVFIEKHFGSVVPPTMMYLAGPVALKGVLTNPLGSTALWRPSTFGGKTGFDIVQKATLRKLFCLNLKGNCKNNVWVSFRRPGDFKSISRKS